VRGGFLDVAERDPGVGRDERMPQRVGPDRLGDSGADGYSADDPGGTQPLPVWCKEDRPVQPLTDG
jgi:hypothetical protein